MKKHNFIKGALGVVLAGGLMACSSDYLDVKPQTSTDSSTVSASVKGARLGLYGICASMYAQWSSFQNYYSFNGESQCMFIYGDMCGQDYFSWIWAGRTSTWALNWDSMTNDNAWLPLLGWIYNYTLVSETNNILEGIDNATGDEAERDFIKAQCLTIRAHAYTRLLQIYGPRWEDSNNGQTECIVMRLTPTTGDSPLVSMNTVLDQIYADLDNAIALYQSSKGRRTYKWEPDLSVAQGVYTRAALLKHDYETAQKMAASARANYPIMSKEDYKSGFALENSEYLWNNEGSSENVLYFAWGAWYTCNGPYPNIWGHGPGAINYDLYRAIPDGNGDNVYKELFFTPDKRLYPGLSSDDFWGEEYVDPVNMNMNNKAPRMTMTIAAFSRSAKPAIGTAWPNACTPVTGESDAAGEVIVPFGAQFKFWSTDGWGTSVFPYMRASELLLSEAEAAYHNGQEGTARNLLNELLAKRIDGYTCSASGSALLDEIRLIRRIELWGEGHSWFDLKRWNLPMERRAWVAKDPTSNNIPNLYAVKKEPSASKGWRWAIPMSETQYNQGIHVGEKVETEPVAQRRLNMTK